MTVSKHSCEGLLNFQSTSTHSHTRHYYHISIGPTSSSINSTSSKFMSHIFRQWRMKGEIIVCAGCRQITTKAVSTMEHSIRKQGSVSSCLNIKDAAMVGKDLKMSCLLSCNLRGVQYMMYIYMSRDSQEWVAPSLLVSA